MAALVIAKHIQCALDSDKPVVALESALITHGFAYPANIDITTRMLAHIDKAGVVPAVTAVYNGQPLVGLTRAQINEIACDTEANKVSIRDLPLCSIRGKNGGTTVAATAWLIHKAGIQVFATGGIGGVHRGQTDDISADLPVLASTPVIVVCAGVKSILDIPRTLEYLETYGVPVVGWNTNDFPAFFTHSSGYAVDISVSDEYQIVEIYRNQRFSHLPQSVLVTVPVPLRASIPVDVIEPLISQAMEDAAEHQISGKDLTPYILAKMANLSASQTRFANESLLLANVDVACKIARALV
jgi:pseudouridine-5'-phosphate glycosidase